MPLKTVAVYWEPKIKTYGFQVLTDLSLLELTFPQEKTAFWGVKLHEMGDLGVGFHLTLALTPNNQAMQLCLLIQRQSEKDLLEHIHKIIQADAGESIRVTSPVELIFFQGPHYGERQGIAEAALGALRTRAVPVLATACSQSCIYLVLPGKAAHVAQSILAQVFEVPRKTRPSKRGPSIADRGIWNE